MADSRRDRRQSSKNSKSTRSGILLGVAGALIASLLVYQVFIKSDDTPVASATKPAVSAAPGATATTTTTAPLEPELPNGSFDELTLRDPFEPVGQISSGDGGTTVPDTTPTTVPDTSGTIPTTPTTSPAQNPAGTTQVALLDVTDTGGGVLVARVSVDGVEYSVKAGDVFATNYKLIQFTSATCADFTFGDSSFNLCTGEQVIK